MYENKTIATHFSNTIQSTYSTYCATKILYFMKVNGHML